MHGVLEERMWLCWIDVLFIECVVCLDTGRVRRIEGK